MNSALIIGHAGHEMRVLKFIELFKPVVFILTDGSGASGNSRAQSTKKILDFYQCESRAPFFTDKEIYEKILRKDINALKKVKDEIWSNLEKNKVDLVFGDALEGFNPTHDLCRYMINSMVGRSENIKNYDFVLDNTPLFEAEKNASIIIKLSKGDKKLRDVLIDSYEEIKKEVQIAKKRFKEDEFDFECIREVGEKGYFEEKKPFYEIYGERKIKEGKYKEIITRNHLLEIASEL